VKDLVARRTALLVVDMTYFSAHPDYGTCAEYRGYGEARRYYVDGLIQITPLVASLVAATRRVGAEVLFTRVQSGGRDGRDRTRHQAHLGLHVAAGTKTGEILAAVGRTADDIVITKAGWGSFYGTNLDPVLRNLGIETLLVCWVTTDGCVEATVREAADRGYRIALIEDACTTATAAAHSATLKAVGSRHTFITTTQYVLEQLARLAPATAGSRRAHATR